LNTGVVARRVNNRRRFITTMLARQGRGMMLVTVAVWLLKSVAFRQALAGCASITVATGRRHTGVRQRDAVVKAGNGVTTTAVANTANRSEENVRMSHVTTVLLAT